MDAPSAGTRPPLQPAKRITRQTSVSSSSVLQNYNRNQIQPSSAPASAKKASAPGKGEEKLREVIMSEVLDRRPSVGWDDVAGLSRAKQVGFGC